MIETREQAKEIFEKVLPFLTDEDIHDQFHSMKELYYYRMLYHSHALVVWGLGGAPVVKSWNHHDGEPCFGGGWFIVTAELPTGQVSNHYPAEYWDIFKCPEVDLPPEWDGHTPNEAAERLLAMFDIDEEGIANGDRIPS